MTNRLYYGDNLEVMRAHVADASVDLIYLDPPFNSNANYNILFKSPAGRAADSQIEAFEDSWHWNDSAEAAFHDVMTSGNTDVAELLRAMRGFLKENDMMAYLAMMAVRLLELHRVLKPTGSLYLHCDPTASHYLKLLLDGVFGGGALGNEIIWQRSTGKSLMSKRLPTNHDIIFLYRKADTFCWNESAIFQEYDEGALPEKTSVKCKYRDEDGRLFRLDSLINPNANRPNLTYEFLGVTKVWRWTKERMKTAYEAGLVVQTKPGTVPQLKRYLDEQRGIALSDVWTDIPPINSQAQERLGYPTQKPLALLERIVAASSNEGDVVLDPFCGCGTAVDAANKLGRQWTGIDITHLAIGLIERRMKDRYGDDLAYEVIGTPNDRASAEKLAADEPHQFQYWITQAIGGQPYQGGRKGADRGIDGYIYFSRAESMDRGRQKHSTEAAIISVKAGQRVGVAMVRDLKGVMEREKAHIGIFVCVINPTREMEREAASAGVYTDPNTKLTYPRLQIFTLAEFFQGHRPKVPLLDRQAAYRKAPREGDAKNQASLL